jgi:hypothetical protein
MTGKDLLHDLENLQGADFDLGVIFVSGGLAFEIGGLEVVEIDREIKKVGPYGQACQMVERVKVIMLSD